MLCPLIYKAIPPGGLKNTLIVLCLSFVGPGVGCGLGPGVGIGLGSGVGFGLGSVVAFGPCRESFIAGNLIGRLNFG